MRHKVGELAQLNLYEIVGNFFKRELELRKLFRSADHTTQIARDRGISLATRLVSGPVSIHT